MVLTETVLQALRDMINEKTTRRSGAALVKLFNQIGGFHDVYGHGFPSRWAYTDEKLNAINGCPELDKVIKYIFSPSLFINRLDELGNLIAEFNEYLVFDGWRITIVGKNVEIHRIDEKEVVDKINREINKGESQTISNELDFLSVEYADVSAEALPISEQVKPIIDSRITEMKKCFDSKAYLASVIICGSLLEGVLLGLASSHPREFNTSNSAPKQDGTVKPFQNWKLTEFIDVAYNIGFIKEDVRKFSHVLRDFRNYIHPFEQMTCRFSPDEHTAKICMQVLKAALFQIIKFQQTTK